MFSSTLNAFLFVCNWLWIIFPQSALTTFPMTLVLCVKHMLEFGIPQDLNHLSVRIHKCWSAWDGVISIFETIINISSHLINEISPSNSKSHFSSRNADIKDSCSRHCNRITNGQCWSNSHSECLKQNNSNSKTVNWVSTNLNGHNRLLITWISVYCVYFYL